MIVAARLLGLTLIPLSLLSAQSATSAMPGRAEIITGLRDSNPDRRIAALRAAESRLGGRSDLILQGILRSLTSDSIGEVRHQLAISLGKTGHDRPALRRFAEVSLRELLVFAAELTTVRVVVQCCADEIGPLLRELLHDPRFVAERVGRPEVLSALAEDLMLQRNAAAIAKLLDLVMAEEAGWRRRAMLSGVLMNLPSGLVDEDKLHFAYRPRALDLMQASEDAELKRAGEEISKVSEWTGGARPLDRGERSLFARGQRLYGRNCIACHRVDGLGVTNLAPPLAGSEWVLGTNERLIRILTSGVTGPITVAGKRYQLSGMVGFKGMEDEQIAALITYLRRAFENQGDPIRSEEVGRIRGEIGDRIGQWTEAELKRIRE